jgi:transcriptional regulator with XRE-family HTH domain
MNKAVQRELVAPEIVGRSLKRRRLRGKLTQVDVMEAVGVSRMTVNNWESGRALPSAAALAGLAQLYGTSVDDLLGLDHSSSHPDMLEGPRPPRSREEFIARLLPKLSDEELLAIVTILEGMVAHPR